MTEEQFDKQKELEIKFFGEVGKITSEYVECPDFEGRQVYLEGQFSSEELRKIAALIDSAIDTRTFREILEACLAKK